MYSGITPIYESIVNTESQALTERGREVDMSTGRESPIERTPCGQIGDPLSKKINNASNWFIL